MVEHRTVAPDVAGSIPVSHPSTRRRELPELHISSLSLIFDIQASSEESAGR
jgi:hypothetical protein